MRRVDCVCVWGTTKQLYLDMNNTELPMKIQFDKEHANWLRDVEDEEDQSSDETEGQHGGDNDD